MSTVTATTSHHHTSDEVAADIRDIVENHEPRDISDSSALAIASWWMAPTGSAATLAQFATTGSADADEMVEAIADAREETGDEQALTELDHLEAWVMANAVDYSNDEDERHPDDF